MKALALIRILQRLETFVRFCKKLNEIMDLLHEIEMFA